MTSEDPPYFTDDLIGGSPQITGSDRERRAER